MIKYNPILSDTFKERFQKIKVADLAKIDVNNEEDRKRVTDKQEEFDESAKFVSDLCHAIDSNGLMPDGSYITLRDFVTSNEIKQFVEPVIETYIRNPISPVTQIANLFDEIPVVKAVDVDVKSFGSFDVAEVAEGGTVPMRIFDVNATGERLALGFKKYGVGIGMTQEAIDADSWGFLSYWMQEARNAFARNRERKAMVALDLKSIIIQDNNGPSQLGPTRGRGISGAFNGTLSPADLAMDLAWANMRDIYYDTIMINPMAYMMFKLYFTESTTRLPSDINFYKPARGKAAPGWPYTNNKFFKRGPGAFGNPTMTDPLGLLENGFPTLAMYGATFEEDIFDTGSPIKIIVSPWVPYKAITDGNAKDKYLTNLYLIDSNNVGAFFNRFGPKVTEWDSPANDVNFWKIVEQFGIGIYNKGSGVGVIKNIVIDSSYDFNFTYNITTEPTAYPAYSSGENPDAMFTGLFA